MYEKLVWINKLLGRSLNFIISISRSSFAFPLVKNYTPPFRTVLLKVLNVKQQLFKKNKVIKVRLNLYLPRNGNMTVSTNRLIATQTGGHGGIACRPTDVTRL